MPLLIIDAHALRVLQPGRRTLSATCMDGLVLPDFIEWAVLLGDDASLRAWLDVHGPSIKTLDTPFSAAVEKRASAWLRAREEGKPRPKVDWDLVALWAAAVLAMDVHSGRMEPERYEVLVEQPDAVRLLAHVGMRTLTAAEAARA